MSMEPGLYYDIIRPCRGWPRASYGPPRLFPRGYGTRIARESCDV